MSNGKKSIHVSPKQLEVIQTIYSHIDGISIGSTLYALGQRGLIQRIAKTQFPLSVNRLSEVYKARRGYLHVAMRLLAGLGFIRLKGPDDSDDRFVLPTEKGKRIARKIGLYEKVPELFRLALGIEKYFFDGPPFARKTSLDLQPFSRSVPIKDAIEKVISGHLQGFIVGPIMKGLVTQGFFEKFERRHGYFVDPRDLGWSPEALSIFSAVLSKLGWLQWEKGKIGLTPKGVVASVMGVQYLHPLSYLPLFQKVPGLLFEEEGFSDSTSNSVETHVDRETDIAFSGIVFKKSCRKPFLNMVLPLFDRVSLEDQPAAVVDTGAGDGTLLIELYKAVKENTLRGQTLGAPPLLMVGVEYDRIAEEICRRNLRASGIPGTVVSGDIGDPPGIARALESEGIDPSNVLHVSKSVVHNRRYRPPGDRGAADAWIPLTRAVFADSEGNLIPRSRLEYNLLEFFLAWRPWTRKHGMVLIEAHTVDPELALSHLGYRVVPSLEATHGYSNQYLMEGKAFERVVSAAGYATLSAVKIGEEFLPHPLLSIHHFIPCCE